MEKTSLFSFVLLVLSLFQMTYQITYPEFLYYQSFEDDSTFDAPHVTKHNAYNDTSAIIYSNDGVLQYINLNIDLEIKEKYAFEFYWRYNITLNYTIGFILQLRNASSYFLIDVTLTSNGVPFVPLSIHSFYGEDDYEHNKTYDTWNYFSIGDLEKFIQSSLGIDYSFVLEDVTFFMFNLNTTGSFMIDDVSIFHYVTEDVSYLYVDNISYFYMILSFLFFAIFLIILKSR